MFGAIVQMIYICFLCQSESHTIIVGGQPLISDTQFLQIWRPTFEIFLTREVGLQYSPPLNFTLVPMDVNTSLNKARLGEVDFLFVNPSEYICLDSEFSGMSVA